MTMTWTVLGMRRSTVLELLLRSGSPDDSYATTHRARQGCTAQLGLYGEYLRSGAGVEVSERSIVVSLASSARSAASRLTASGSASRLC